MSRTWGTSYAERSVSFPGDKVDEQFDEALYRGVSIRATPDLVFRWLCQMRIAPYSYDWIDNLGRRSPRRLVPGLEKLAQGQAFMYIFRLVSFEPGRYLTLRMRADVRAARLFGDIVASYMIVPQTGDSCRLLVRLLVRYPRGTWGWLMSNILPWGDLLMMRRQLLNFKLLSECNIRVV